jgi:DNA polymerase-3 subunit gamma/tau
MEYVVLARKLRPMRFGELIGQETVAKALRNAVQGERTAHAYLFAGSRGVGKTSAARILTKALNCMAPQEGEPCNACANCEEITHNASPDIYEIDAASNRGIDNIRELRENTKYAPAKCRSKTYIIDEVHMLTMESFNALLKTLEEPPPHIKFILATTSPHRIPETILSRCQRFDFPRIPLGPMVEYLTRVTGEEEITLSPASLEVIARNAAGGMRDALTGVDQVVAFAGAAPSDEQVLGVLGVMDTREVLELLGAVLDKSVEQVLAAFAAILERGHDLTTLLEALLRDIKDLALYQSLGGATTYFQDHPPTTLEFFGQRKDAHTLDELQQLFHLFLDLEGQLRQSEHSRACFEMALIKACRVAPLVGVPELLAQVRELGRHPPATSQATQPEHRPSAQARPRGREAGAAAGPARETAPEQDAEAERPGRQAASQAPQREQPPPAVPGEAKETTSPPDAPGEAKEPSTPAAGGCEPAPPAQAESLGPALCEDGRWLAFVNAVKAERPKLAADLRRTEVSAIGEDAVRIVPPAGVELGAQELEMLHPMLREAFGAAFHLHLNQPRPHHRGQGRTETGGPPARRAAGGGGGRDGAAHPAGISRQQGRERAAP